MFKLKTMRKCYSCGTDTEDNKQFTNWGSKGATVSICFTCLGGVSNKSPRMPINLEIGKSSISVIIERDDSELVEGTIKWVSGKLRKFVNHNPTA